MKTSKVFFQSSLPGKIRKKRSSIHPNLRFSMRYALLRKNASIIARYFFCLFYDFVLPFDNFLFLSDLDKSDNGVYTCVASSPNGKASWSANLRLESPTNPNIGFFRSPEPSSFPGPPTRPTAVNKTRNAITIQWSRSNKIGSSSLLGYQVKNRSPFF